MQKEYIAISLIAIKTKQINVKTVGKFYQELIKQFFYLFFNRLFFYLWKNNLSKP